MKSYGRIFTWGYWLSRLKNYPAPIYRAVERGGAAPSASTPSSSTSTPATRWRSAPEGADLPSRRRGSTTTRRRAVRPPSHSNQATPSSTRSNTITYSPAETVTGTRISTVVGAPWGHPAVFARCPVPVGRGSVGADPVVGKMDVVGKGPRGVVAHGDLESGDFSLPHALRTVGGHHRHLAGPHRRRNAVAPSDHHQRLLGQASKQGKAGEDRAPRNDAVGGQVVPHVLPVGAEQQESGVGILVHIGLDPRDPHRAVGAAAQGARDHVAASHEGEPVGDPVGRVQAAHTLGPEPIQDRPKVVLGRGGPERVRVLHHRRPGLAAQVQGEERGC